MKKLILFMLLLISSLAYAQDTKTYYCELLGKSKFLSNKVNVTVDFGQEKQGWHGRLVDSDGKAINFNTMVDAMNYLGQFGWKFVQAYAVSIPNSKDLVYHYLLSKEVLSSEDPYSGIYTKADYQADQKEADDIEKDSDMDKKSKRKKHDDMYSY